LSEQQHGETLEQYKVRLVQEHVALLQADMAKVKERLLLFFFILLASNILSPELAALLRLAFPH
jgi:hypothetical protein